MSSVKNGSNNTLASLGKGNGLANRVQLSGVKTGVENDMF